MPFVVLNITFRTVFRDKMESLRILENRQFLRDDEQKFLLEPLEGTIEQDLIKIVNVYL